MNDKCSKRIQEAENDIRRILLRLEGYLDARISSVDVYPLSNCKVTIIFSKLELERMAKIGKETMEKDVNK